MTSPCFTTSALYGYVMTSRTGWDAVSWPSEWRQTHYVHDNAFGGQVVAEWTSSIRFDLRPHYKSRTLARKLNRLDKAGLL